MLGVPVLSIGTVGDNKVGLNSLNILSDRLGELCQRYIYRTGGTIDFHKGINIGQKKDIPSTKSTCCFAGLLFSIGARFSGVVSGGSPTSPPSPRVVSRMYTLAHCSANIARVPPANKDSSSGCADTAKIDVISLYLQVSVSELPHSGKGPFAQPHDL